MPLQWGRGFSAAERGANVTNRGQESAASMGPRLFSRGKQYVKDQTEAVCLASMGPRLFSRGKDVGAALAEIRDRASMGPRLFSRGKETCGTSPFLEAALASMGPRLFSRGKEMERYNERKDWIGFNGAAAFQPRKDGKRHTGDSR